MTSSLDDLTDEDQFDILKKTIPLQSADLYLKHGWTGSFYFTRADIENATLIESAADVVKRAGGDNSADFVQTQLTDFGLIASRFTALADSRATKSGNDYIDLSFDALVTVMGSRLKDLVALFTENDTYSLDSVLLRRLENTAVISQYHVNNSDRVMHVYLNSNYTGARRIFVHNDVFHSPSFDTGTVIIQGKTLVHGTSLLSSGVAYALYLTGSKK